MKLGQESLKKWDGPCIQAIQQTLHQIGADRQAYHGGAFIGNHVHMCCKVCMFVRHMLMIPKSLYNAIIITIYQQDTNIVRLTQSIKVVTRGTAISAQACEVAEKFKEVFLCFARCHNLNCKL